MSKRAFLVLGPESSGTRLMTRLLIAAGCDGDGDRTQRWDTQTPTADPIVWRRSVPHRREWPDTGAMLAILRDADYAPHIIITSRDWHAMARSQVEKHPPVTVNEAREHIQRAYRHIFRGIGSTRFELVNYETLQRAPARRTLFARMALPEPAGVEVYDGNAKYYEVDYAS